MLIQERCFICEVETGGHAEKHKEIGVSLVEAVYCVAFGHGFMAAVQGHPELCQRHGNVLAATMVHLREILEGEMQPPVTS